MYCEGDKPVRVLSSLESLNFKCIVQPEDATNP